MELKTLATMASLLLLAAPVFAGPDGNEPSSADVRNREIHDQQIQKLATQKVMASVQSRLPQAQIADLLNEIDEASRGTGPIPAAVAGKIEDELARQKQFWYEEYQRALKQGTGDGSLEAFRDSPETGKEFDDLVASSMTKDTSGITPQDLRVVYEEYDSISQTFQQLKLARFLAGSKDGIPTYGRPKVDKAQAETIATDVEANYVPGYEKRLQEGVSNLRKILIAATKAE